MCSLCSDNNGFYFTENENEEVVIISRYMPKAYHNTINKDDSLRQLYHVGILQVPCLLLRNNFVSTFPSPSSKLKTFISL